MRNELHKYQLTILEGHLDTFGHVNNATYLQLFEEARWAWIHGNGYGLEEVQRTQQGPTILEVKLRFKRELKNRTRVVIESSVESYDSKVGRLVQRIVDHENNLCCDAQMAFGLFDLRERKLIPPTEKWLRAVGFVADDR